MVILFNKKNILLGHGLALIAGSCMPLAFAPFEFRFVAFFSISILILLLHDVSPKLSFIRCFIYGAGMYGFGVYWVYNSLHDFGEAPFIVAGLITACLVATLAFFFAIMGYVYNRWAQFGLMIKLLLLFPALWLLKEWVQSWIFSGFPWLLMGYSQIDTLLSAYIPIIGALGVSGVFTVICGAIVIMILGSGREKIIAGISIVLVYGFALLLIPVNWTQASGKALSVGLVQGNIPQAIKLQPDKLHISLDRYLELSRRQYHNDLLIWPETAIPTYKRQAESFLNKLSAELDNSDTELLTGIFYYDYVTRKRFNSMYKVGTELDIYHKQHLVPFGEYIPFRWMLSFLNDFILIPESDLSHGGNTQNSIELKGIPVSVSICYESAYSSIFRDQLPQAEILINSSNDAWFGDSLAPYQHLEIAQTRALESGRYLLRATNTGISAIIGPKGNVIKKGEAFKAIVVDDKVYPYSGATPFTKVGNALPVLLAFIVILLIPIKILRVVRKK